MIKRIICTLLAIVLLLPFMASCEEGSGEARLLSFSQANSIEEMKKLDGKTVTIIGYMSTLSPVSGKFMYLMNLPYQSCPFCVPNTTQLSNTMAVYAKDKDEFEFTDRAISVTGTLEFKDFVDEFGYEYNYRIKDATYTVLDTTSMSHELQLWQQLASTDVISEVYRMFEYTNFLCFWGTYSMNFDGGRDYLYPSDAVQFIENDGAQFNYGFKDGYFDALIAKIREVDGSAFEELVNIIERAQALCVKAYGELKSERYTAVPEYSGEFGDGRTQYKLDAVNELEVEMTNVYRAFSEWLANWEL